MSLKGFLGMIQVCLDIQHLSLVIGQILGIRDGTISGWPTVNFHMIKQVVIFFLNNGRKFASAPFFCEKMIMRKISLTGQLG